MIKIEQTALDKHSTMWHTIKADETRQSFLLKERMLLSVRYLLGHGKVAPLGSIVHLLPTDDTAYSGHMGFCALSSMVMMDRASFKEVIKLISEDLQELIKKGLDKRQAVCDTKAVRETTVDTAFTTGTLTTEEWKAAMELDE